MCAMVCFAGAYSVPHGQLLRLLSSLAVSPQAYSDIPSLQSPPDASNPFPYNSRRRLTNSGARRHCPRFMHESLNPPSALRHGQLQSILPSKYSRPIIGPSPLELFTHTLCSE